MASVSPAAYQRRLGRPCLAMVGMRGRHRDSLKNHNHPRDAQEKPYSPEKFQYKCSMRLKTSTRPLPVGDQNDLAKSGDHFRMVKYWLHKIGN